METYKNLFETYMELMETYWKFIITNWKLIKIYWKLIKIYWTLIKIYCKLLKTYWNFLKGYWYMSVEANGQRINRIKRPVRVAQILVSHIYILIPGLLKMLSNKIFNYKKLNEISAKFNRFLSNLST